MIPNLLTLSAPLHVNRDSTESNWIEHMLFCCCVCFIVLYMPIRDMYNVATRTHAAWGIDGYEISKKYFDHNKAVEDKLYEEMRKKGKAIKNSKHITKKGCFLDDEYSC